MEELHTASSPQLTPTLTKMPKTWDWRKPPSLLDSQQPQAPTHHLALIQTAPNNDSLKFSAVWSKKNTLRRIRQMQRVKKSSTLQRIKSTLKLPILFSMSKIFL